ncbi:MAG: phage head morphogenesis protein [Candidatus Thiodiazotropha sp. (ex Dulcina madagascariensis)]|nr:phage head morphogenesis protein [Candidatus Thiodiazotropha sp. (ex Dulcina madagascariensis)]
MVDKRTTDFNRAVREQLKNGLRIRRDTYAELVKLLREAEASIIQTLTSGPSEWETFYLTRLQSQIKSTLKEVEARAAAVVAEGAGASWQAGVNLIDEPLAAGGIRISGLLPQISTDQLAAMRFFMVDRIKDVPISMANKISGQLGLTMMGAQSVGETVTNIKNLFKTQGRARALTIVRTEIGGAFSVAGHLRKQQAGELLPGLRKQWRRSGKIHSRVSHDMIDGQVQPIDEPFRLGNGTTLMYPRDPRASAKERINCGCESLPWMEHWEMTTPGKKPFGSREQALNPRKAALSQEAADIWRMAYNTAATGGKHAGTLRRYRAVSTTEIRRGIRSLERQIGKHQAWLADPTLKVDSFYNLPEVQQLALLEKRWPEDILRQREKIGVMRGLLENRDEN